MEVMLSCSRRPWQRTTPMLRPRPWDHCRSPRMQCFSPIYQDTTFRFSHQSSCRHRRRLLSLLTIFLVLCSVLGSDETQLGYRNHSLASDEFTGRFGEFSATSSRSTIECKIILFDTIYQDRDGHFSTREHLVCVPVSDGGVLSDNEYRIDLPETMQLGYRQKIRQGSFYVRISNVSVERDQLLWSNSSTFETLSHDRRLSMAQTIGTRTVAVLKISTIDASLDISVADMDSILFGVGNVNFISQYAACSFGQLVWEPVEGVIQVDLPQSIASFDGPSAIVAAAQAQLLKDRPNLESISDLADSVMFCVPPGLKSGDFIANAGVNYWRSAYYGEWCLSLSATSHELGHNLGLLHSNEVSELYGDLTGYMGAGYKATTWPRKCFNAFNQWQLKWYDSRLLYVDPLKDGPKLVKLAAFTDYDLASPATDVIVNIDDKYFLSYNRAKTFNIDTEEKRDMVTVTVPTESGTNCVAGMRSGQRYEIAAFKDGTLIIEVCRMVFGSPSSPDIALVSVGIGVSLCNAQFIAVHDVPTMRPSKRPAAVSALSPVVLVQDISPAPRVRFKDKPVTMAPWKEAAIMSNTISDEFTMEYRGATPSMRPSTAPTTRIASASPSMLPSPSKRIKSSQPSTIRPTTKRPLPVTTATPTSSPQEAPFRLSNTSSPSTSSSTIVPMVDPPTSEPTNLSTLTPTARITVSSSPTMAPSILPSVSPLPTPTIPRAYHKISETSAFNFDSLFSEVSSEIKHVETSMEQSEQSAEAGFAWEPSPADIPLSPLETLVPADLTIVDDDTGPALIIPFASETSGQAKVHVSNIWLLCASAMAYACIY